MEPNRETQVEAKPSIGLAVALTVAATIVAVVGVVFALLRTSSTPTPPSKQHVDNPGQ